MEGVEEEEEGGREGIRVRRWNRELDYQEGRL